MNWPFFSHQEMYTIMVYILNCNALSIAQYSLLLSKHYIACRPTLHKVLARLHIIMCFTV